MEFKKRTKPSTFNVNGIRIWAVALLGVGVSACTNSIVPNDATLMLTPSTHTIDIVEMRNATGQCEFFEANHLDVPLNIALSTNNGSPIGDEWVSIYTDFSENTYSGRPVLTLYEDINGNGVVDVDSELISGLDDDIARVRTDKFTGTKLLLLRINLSCAFRGEVRALAGPANGAASFAVIQQGS
ncbi:MAG: hypothetical protein AB8B84_15660 [Granulosicoccus sp.]